MLRSINVIEVGGGPQGGRRVNTIEQGCAIGRDLFACTSLLNERKGFWAVCFPHGTLWVSPRAIPQRHSRSSFPMRCETGRSEFPGLQLWGGRRLTKGPTSSGLKGSQATRATVWEGRWPWVGKNSVRTYCKASLQTARASKYGRQAPTSCQLAKSRPQNPARLSSPPPDPRKLPSVPRR